MNEEYPGTPGEKAAFELGKQIGYMEAKIDSIGKSIDRIGRIYHTSGGRGLCNCCQCEERREAQANEQHAQAERDYRQSVLREG